MRAHCAAREHARAGSSPSTPTCRSGRGSAHVAIDALDGDRADARRSGGRARAARRSARRGRRSRPPRPRASSSLDPALATRDPVDAAATCARSSRPPTRGTVTRERPSCASTSSCRRTAASTPSGRRRSLRVDALVAAGERSLAISREARRVRSTSSSIAAVADAIADLALLAAAGPPDRRAVRARARADALLHGGLGVWAGVREPGRCGRRAPGPHAVSRDSADRAGRRSGRRAARRSRATARCRSACARRRSATTAMRCASSRSSSAASPPGSGCRRARPRCASRDPNGGVRNLVVALGTWDGDARRAASSRSAGCARSRSIRTPATRASRSRSASIPRRESRPFTGGTLRLDLIDALARRTAKRAHDARVAVLRGAASVLIEHAELIA